MKEELASPSTDLRKQFHVGISASAKIQSPICVNFQTCPRQAAFRWKCGCPRRCCKIPKSGNCSNMMMMMMMIDDGKDGGHHADKGGGHHMMAAMMANKMIRTMVDKMKRARVAKFLWERVQPRVIREIRLLCSAWWAFGGRRGQEGGIKWRKAPFNMKSFWMALVLFSKTFSRHCHFEWELDKDKVYAKSCCHIMIRSNDKMIRITTHVDLPLFWSCV